MNYVRLINWTIIRWDMVVKVDYEVSNHKDNEIIYTYVFLSDGEKCDFFETMHCCVFEDEEYVFCTKCATKYAEFLIRNIESHFSSGNNFYDVGENDSKVFSDFGQWLKENKDKVMLRKK